MNSAFRAIWLVPQSRDIKYYSPPGGFRVKKMSRETHFIRKWSNFLGIAIKLVLYILKQLFASVSGTSGGYLPRRSGSVNIHRYSPPLLRIIVNYRPISMLPIFSKIVEQVMLSRLKIFLETNQIISEQQYGFQKTKSTTLAVLDLLNNIVESFENKSVCSVVFLDFAKAFDTVNHNILIDKLENYGLRGIPKKWFKSYLTDRQQIVCINEKLSSKLTVDCGVPQGSVLGPILFLLYINDIANSLLKSKCLLFADDTSLFHSSKNIQQLESTLNNDLNNIQEWLLCNKLSLNVSKSSCVTFSPKQKHTRSLQLEINCEIIKEKTTTKYLGVIVDKHLTWKHHLESIKTKLAKITGIIFKIRHYVPLPVLKHLYSSLFYPHLNYANLLWGNATASALKPIETLQKKVIRAMLNEKWDCHTTPLFHKLNILKLKNALARDLFVDVFS